MGWIDHSGCLQIAGPPRQRGRENVPPEGEGGGRLGGLGLLIDSVWSAFRPWYFTLLQKYSCKSATALLEAGLLRPRDKGAVAGRFHSARLPGQQRAGPAYEGGDALYSFMISAPSGVMPTIAAHAPCLAEACRLPRREAPDAGPGLRSQLRACRTRPAALHWCCLHHLGQSRLRLTGCHRG